MKTYFIRKVADNEMMGAFEGEDGKQRAYDLVAINNRFFAAKLYVSEEII